jgi:hypothetical protein
MNISRALFTMQLFTISMRRPSNYQLAYNFFVASFICFRCLEFWSLGGLENFYNLLQDSETPNLPVAEAIIKVILIYIPVRSAGGGLTN